MDMTASLVGREPELTQIADRLEAARGGAGSTLLVRGEAGIGKSILLRTVEASAAPRTRVLRTTGREGEQELPFAALAALLHPVLDRLPSLPPPQTAALRGALALEDAVGVEPFAVAAATLSLLTMTAEDRPLLCVVDDAQWLDAASAGVVLFVAQRIADVAALVLMAARDGEDLPRGMAALPSLRLSGLDTDEGVELLGRNTRQVLAPAVARRLVQRTDGNPLALLELQMSLSQEVLSGRSDLATLLPVGETLTALFLRRAASMPGPTREALLRAAADSQLVTGDIPALEPAERAGIVEVRDGHVEYRHPLMRSAVYYGADEPDRRRAHAELAASQAPDDTSPRRALHLARAAPGPDETIAVELESNAHRTLARGGLAEAGALLELAADLSPDAPSRACRRAAAALALFFSGEIERATAAIARADQESDDDVAKVALDRVRGTILLWTGDVRTAHTTLVEAGERAAHTDPVLAVAILSDAVWGAMTVADVRSAGTSASRAAELAEGLGGFAEDNARAQLLRVHVIAGDAGLRAAAATRLRSLISPESLLDSEVAGYALTFIWVEAFDEAARLLQAGTQRTREAGALTTLPVFLAVQCELATWRGDLRGALRAGGEAELLCAQLGNHVAHPYVLSVLARAEALAGREHDAETHARAALAFSRPRGIDSIEIYAACALGALALAQGRHADAVGELGHLPELYAELGIGEPNSMPWLGDLAEAAVLAGDNVVADGALGVLDRMAQRTGSRWAAGVAARARALRGPHEGLETEISHAATSLHDMPFELARVHLVHGERLRRARRRADSRAPLRQALESFERIGAERWAARARRELAAAGELSADRATPPERLLSPQELQVALLVGEGLSNREAAARLILSPKTVEYHLGNAFRKLGVRSRVELVRRLERS